MPSGDKPLIYLVLGALGSGRREVLVDLIEAGLAPDDRAAVMLAADEPPNEFEAKLPAVTRWTWREGAIEGELPADATHVFFVTSGSASQIDQIEAFKAWLGTLGQELARALCVVNCQLAEKHSPLLAWYEACVHFSDVVLLNHREGVDNKWLTGFLTHFKKQYYPCVFEMVKGGRVKNPALILEPQARRMTHVFDEEQDWVITNAEGEVVDEEDETTDDEELQAKPEEDPYFARRNEGGRRLKELPDIRKFL
jgi:hypothetical protein